MTFIPDFKLEGVWVWESERKRDQDVGLIYSFSRCLPQTRYRGSPIWVDQLWPYILLKHLSHNPIRSLSYGKVNLNVCFRRCLFSPLHVFVLLCHVCLVRSGIHCKRLEIAEWFGSEDKPKYHLLTLNDLFQITVVWNMIVLSLFGYFIVLS